MDSTAPTPKAQLSLQRRGQKAARARGVGIFVERLSPEDERSYTHSLTKWLQRWAEKDDTSKHGNAEWEGCERGLNITQRTRANEAMLREPEVVFPREEHNNWLFQCQTVTYTSKIVHSKQIHTYVCIHICICKYTHIYIICICNNS